jgi:hypothetical protein
MAIQKTNNKKMLIIGGIILGAAGLAYVYREKIMNYFVPKIEPEPEPEPIIPIPIIKGKIDNNNQLPEPKPKAKANPIDIKLKKGDKGDNVKLLQYNIREVQFYLGVPQIKADGDFGAATDKAALSISKFYKENGYWTIRKARELAARYAGEKGLRFPVYLSTVSNLEDLQKIYQTGLVKNRVGKFTTNFGK